MFTLNTSFPLGFSMNLFLEPICEEDQVRMKFFFLTIFEIYKMKDETIIIIIIIEIIYIYINNNNIIYINNNNYFYFYFFVFVHGKEIDKQRHQSILKRGSSPNRKQGSCIPWAIYFTKWFIFLKGHDNTSSRALVCEPHIAS